MNARRALSPAPVLVLGILGLASLQAQSNPDTTLTINASGTIGPALSGSDPLNASGESATLKVMVSESLSPTRTTATSATYTLPPGAIMVSVGTTTYATTSASTMKITLPAKGPDAIVLTATVKQLGVPIALLGTIDLKHGSFPASVLTHPTVFRPSPQTLTAATSTTGTGTKLQYTFLGSTTILGVSGMASDKAAMDPFLPEDDSDQ